MRSLPIGTLVTAATTLLCGRALAQEEFTLPWNTIDCGGGQSSGDEFEIAATIAQPDAGIMQGPEGLETFSIVGGFWGNVQGGGCYPNCDGSTGSPLLTGNDFVCFLNAFAASQANANCDGSTTIPTLTANDFVCFINKFSEGCT